MKRTITLNIGLNVNGVAPARPRTAFADVVCNAVRDIAGLADKVEARLHSGQPWTDADGKTHVEDTAVIRAEIADGVHQLLAVAEAWTVHQAKANRQDSVAFLIVTGPDRSAIGGHLKRTGEHLEYIDEYFVRF